MVDLLFRILVGKDIIKEELNKISYVIINRPGVAGAVL